VSLIRHFAKGNPVGQELRLLLLLQQNLIRQVGVLWEVCHILSVLL
jgi:hypothetical protein